MPTVVDIRHSVMNVQLIVAKYFYPYLLAI